MKLVWDDTGNRLYETGVEKGVLYPKQSDGSYDGGVAWNGLVSVSESPSGAEATPLYADNVKYLNLMSTEEFGATIEAFTYPAEFEACDGSANIGVGVAIGQQTRSIFGLSYKTKLGNDVDGNDHGYKLHLIYGALAAPSAKAYETINETPEAITFSWEISTTPVEVEGFKPTATVVINSTKVDADKLATLEDILYGTADVDPRMPLPNELLALFAATIEDLAMDTIVPADDATDIAVDSTIVMTFNNAIQEEAIVVTDADGTIVAGTKAWDATNKILTFTPTSDLDASTVYLVTVAGVVDVYAQTLAAEVSNFTTAA